MKRSTNRLALLTGTFQSAVMWFSRRKDSDGFTTTERRVLERTSVWIVWYEDQFTHDPSFPVAICLSAGQATEEVARRGRPLHPGFDGYSVTGPTTLLDPFSLRGGEQSLARLLLRHLEAGSAGTLFVPI